MKSIKYIGLMIILSVIGFLIKDVFFNQSLHQLDMGNTQLMTNSINGQLKSHLLFSLSVGIIPILYLIVEKITKIKFRNQGLITLAVIIYSGIICWQLRIFQLKTQLQKLTELNLDNATQNVMDIRSLNFELYLLAGFVVGTILSVLIYRGRNKKEDETVN